MHGTRAFWRKILPLHLLGQAIGGLFLGLVAGTIGLVVSLVVPSATRMLALAGVVALYALWELAPSRLWRPNSRWQVPEGFRRTPYTGTMSLLWGAALGTGWLTMNITSAFLVTFLALVAGPPWLALLGGTVFGLAQGSTLLLALGAPDFDTLVLRFGMFMHHTRLAALTTAALGLALATALTVDSTN